MDVERIDRGWRGRRGSFMARTESSGLGSSAVSLLPPHFAAAIEKVQYSH
jgi:hypothetical protein